MAAIGNPLCKVADSNRRGQGAARGDRSTGRAQASRQRKCATGEKSVVGTQGERRLARFVRGMGGDSRPFCTGVEGRASVLYGRGGGRTLSGSSAISRMSSLYLHASTFPRRAHHVPEAGPSRTRQEQTQHQPDCKSGAGSQKQSGAGSRTGCTRRGSALLVGDGAAVRNLERQHRQHEDLRIGPISTG